MSSTRFKRGSLAALAITALVGGTMLALAPAGNAANSVADARNLIANSNFAAPHITGTFVDFAAPSTAITGWTVTGDTVDLASHTLWQGPAGDPANQQSIDLQGTGSGSGAISQTLTTVVGTTYTGSFELAGNTACNPVVKTGVFTAGSFSQPFSFDTTGLSATNMGWTQVNFSFVANSTSTPIGLASTVGAGSGCGAVVTDIIVDPPLPPAITTNPNLTVYQTTPAGTPVPFTVPTATDPNNGNAAVPVGCTPGSNSVFPVGSTVVTCTATTPEGSSASSQFTIKVLKIATACQGLPLDDKGYLQAHPNYAANGGITPCVANSNYTSIGVGPLVLIPGIPLLHILPTGLNAAVLHGVTNVTLQPGLVQTSANSTLAAVTVSAPGLTLEAHGLYSQASATLSGGLCNDGITTGLSTIAALRINGQDIVVGTAPITINLGVIKIYVNQTVRVGNTITQRALYIDLLSHSTWITVGQSVAGVACS